MAIRMPARDARGRFKATKRRRRNPGSAGPLLPPVTSQVPDQWRRGVATNPKRAKKKGTIPITLNGETVSYSERAHSTLFEYDLAAVGEEAYLEQLSRDEILKYTVGGTFENLVTPKTVEPYGRADAENFTIDYATLEQYLGFFAGCKILVADPGAEIDLLAAVGRFDLIQEYLDFLRGRFDTVITSVHHAGITIPLIEEHNIEFDGYIVPINEPGMYMFPIQDRVVDAVICHREFLLDFSSVFLRCAIIELSMKSYELFCLVYNLLLNG